MPDLTPNLPAHSTHADRHACGACRRLAADGKPVEHEECAARARLVEAPDMPGYEDLCDLTDEQRAALPARFHIPVFDGDGVPNAWLCAACWGADWVAKWPCATALEHGREVFSAAREPARPTPGHMAVYIDNRDQVWCDYPTLPPSDSVLPLVWAAQQAQSKEVLEDEGAGLRIVGWCR
jgi:hypothetical protein